MKICKGVKLLIFFFVSIIWGAGRLSGRTEDFTHKIGKSEIPDNLPDNSMAGHNQ